MPRIDPLQLLKCLSVLLSPEGGILSRNEVPRLVSLMTKFSKKLVSKCVYVLILKNTETSLVDMFMAENGWTLVQSWLQDAVPTGNWVLVKEILELLLVTPVDVDRLKLNHLPKLIKSLTRKEGHPEVAQLSDRIVQNWLMIVKGSASGIAVPGPALIPVEPPPEVSKNEMTSESVEAIKEEAEDVVDGNVGPIKPESFYKVTVKNGKQVIRKLSAEKDNEKDEIDKKNDKEKSLKSSSSSSKPSSSSSKPSSSSSKPSSSSSKPSSSSSKSSSSSRDKDRNKSSSSSGSTSKSSSSRDKSRDKDRDRKDKDRKSSSSKSNSKSSHSSSTSKSKDKKDSKEKSKDSKENQSEKDKEALDKLLNPKPFKSARIPKLSSNDKPKENKSSDRPKENEAEVKKPSYSILNRKTTGEERGKTVKVFNSKMRSTGLEEIAKPPPKRSSKKPTPSIQLPTIPLKRPSPPRDSMVPPEKKIKIDKIDKAERPGAIKLIAPKPKPILLQESDMFSDALTAASPKKDAKKRKRRLSTTKESTGSPSSGGDAAPASSPTPSSPTTLKNIAPINFYQDTLSEQPEKNEMEKEDDAVADEDNNYEKDSKSPKKEDDDDDDETPLDSPTADIKIQIENEDMPPPPKQIKLEGELKGILVHEKKQSIKRSIQWKAEKDLVQTRYFELDETERINVTKTFTDMAKMDIDGEREAMINSRISSEDKMAPAIQWYAPFLCEDLKSLIVPGTKSLEKDIQFAREKATPAAEYFNKRMIPDNPKEPELEVHQKEDPTSIPLEDPEGHIIDLANKPWPESKGFDPKMEIQQQMPPMFSNNVPFNSNFNNMPPAGVQFVGVPQRFPGPPGPHGPMMGPANFNGPHMMHNNMVVPQMNQPDMMNGGPMNPGMFAPGPGPDSFMGVPNEQPYPMPQFNGGPQGPMYVPNNYNHQRGGNNGGRGGGFRRGGGGGVGGWVQVNGPRAWKRGSGGPHRGSNRPCKNIQNHGYCRNLDSCPFRH